MQALYRKYRPQKFSEVAGQDHIVDVLSASVKDGHHAHAYLFAGSRGTGKTSIARILARALGCSDTDLYEIDGASTRGIDDIRELRESVRSLPFSGPVKVYIIDEVHMLTQAAFNALLKTLEEPPSYVIFILATTEIARVPDTIVSRCETHIFKKPTQNILEKNIARVAKAEGYDLEPGVAEVIAIAGDGSFRDTLGLLQKSMALSGDKKITLAEAERSAGSPPRAIIRTVFQALLDRTAEPALVATSQARESGYDFKTILKLLMNDIRSAMLIKYAPEMKREILADLSTEDGQFLEEASSHVDSARLPIFLKVLIDTYADTEKSAIDSIPLEIAIVKLAEEGK